jgi:hypothetical protein
MPEPLETLKFVVLILAGIPLVQVIWDHYYGMYVSLSQAANPPEERTPQASTAYRPAEAGAAADDHRYEAALQTALGILHDLATRPEKSRPEKLSTITFMVLNAMRQVEKQQSGWLGGEPSVE